MAQSAMSLVAALEVLRQVRTDQIVVSSMGTAREWPRLSHHPLDLHYVPSAMGQVAILGLGLALAQPARRVIALSGDGSLLMNLGCLVTIAACEPANFTLILFDNSVFEVTGGQKTAAGASQAAGRPVDWIALARSAGIQTAVHFDHLADWQSQAAENLLLVGPSLIVLKVAPVTSDFSLESPGPIAERLARFRAALEKS